MSASPSHLLRLPDLTVDTVKQILALGHAVKKSRETYADALKQKTLLMIFAKPSLRTRISFEAGMTQLGGHAIYYDIATSPMGGVGKETIADSARACTRMVDLVMARLFEHTQIEEFAANSSVPVINGLTNYTHPCQILADLMTIEEKKGVGSLPGRTLAYCGDGNNNVTHSLLYGCAMTGVNIRVACPAGTDYTPLAGVVELANDYASKAGSQVLITNDAAEAVSGADVVYTDSWMSYHIPKEQRPSRLATFMPFQVTEALMKLAKPDAVFMNCLPAMRGEEQTAGVVDGPQSIVFDQAENRLHAQKAAMLVLLGKA
ncbi:MAG: ornithine carbamoyltransferase [Planctomycetota bacterium]